MLRACTVGTSVSGGGRTNGLPPAAYCSGRSCVLVSSRAPRCPAQRAPAARLLSRLVTEGDSAMQAARLRILGLLAVVGALGLTLAFFLTAGAAQAAPPAVPGNGNGNGNGHGNSQAAGQGQGQGQQGGGPAVVWATGQVSTTLATGASLDTTATFTVTRALSNLRVRLTGNVRGVVTVTPSTFAQVVPGQT